MNIIRLLDEFKNTSNRLLLYNEHKLVQLLQKFSFFNINGEDYPLPIGPVAPLVEPSSPQAPTGYIWPTDLCITNPTGYQAPTGPTGPVSYETIEAYINNIDCYIDIADDETVNRMKIFNYEASKTLSIELNMIHNLESAENYHSSQIKTIKRKIHEYDLLIQKYKSLLVDYKQNMLTEYDKKPVTLREINREISSEIARRLNEVELPTDIVTEIITKQVTDDVNAKYTISSRTQKFDAFSAGWFAANEKIDYLTNERNKLRKLVLIEYTPRVNSITLDNNLTIVDQDRYRISELKMILEKLKMIDATDEQLQDVIDKIAELENKY